MKHASYQRGPFLVLTFEDGSWALYVGPRRSVIGFWFEVQFRRWLPVGFEWRLGRRRFVNRDDDEPDVGA